MLHEGVPTILFDQQNHTMHVNTAGSFNVNYSIRIKFNNIEKECERELKPLINYTYKETQNEVKKITDKIITALKK